MPKEQDFEYAEIKDKGFIRTVRTPKVQQPTIEERLAALEAEHADLKARLSKVEKASKINPA